MHFFSSLFAKGALGVGAAASLALGAGTLKHDDVQKVRPVQKPAVEIVINAHNALVRGATVTAISGSTLTAATLVGSTTLVWTVNTDANTQVIASSTNSLASVAVGDTVSFSGPVHAGATALTVDANVVRDASKLPAVPLKLKGEWKTESR